MSFSKAVFARTFKEALIPMLGALGWATFAYFRAIERSTYVLIGSGSAAFALLFYLQGQFLRIVKNVRDERNFRELQNSVGGLAVSLSTIQQSIDALRVPTNVPSTARYAEDVAKRLGGDTSGAQTEEAEYFYSGQQPIEAYESESLISHAEATLKAGKTFAALLTAAVAFEEAVMRAGIRLGVSAKTSSYSTLQRLSPFIDKTRLGELLHLHRLRNDLVHVQPDRVDQHLKNANVAIDAFRWGVNFMDALGD